MSEQPNMTAGVDVTRAIALQVLDTVVWPRSEWRSLLGAAQRAEGLVTVADGLR